MYWAYWAHFLFPSRCGLQFVTLHWVYSFIYKYLNEIYFCSNYGLIYMILDNLTIFWLWYIEFLFLLYYWFQVKDYYKYIVILSIWFFYIHAWIRYIFVRNYDSMYMIMNILTMNWFWYPTNGGYSLVFWYSANGGYLLVLWYPNQWGLFIGILPKPMWVIHWYSDTQANGSYSLVFWYPANEGYSLVLWCPVTRI